MLTTLVVALVFVLALVLTTPVDFDIRLERRPVLECRCAIRWLYGLVGKEFQPKAKEKPRAKPERRKKRGKHRDIAGMLRAKGFRGGVVRLVRRVLYVLRLRDLALWLRVGFEDPADTGVLCGYLMPAAVWAQALPARSVEVFPDFSQETLEFTLAGRARVIPAQLLWPFLVFGLSPSTWRGVAAMGKGRRR